MDSKDILVDTSIFIDYYRKSNKDKALLTELIDNYNLAISTITVFEIFNGIKNEQETEFWDTLFNIIKQIPFNSEIAILSANIYQNLKRANQIIELNDLFIATTAVYSNLPIVTFNKNHFKRISGLQLL
ncbi:MAG: type II toxin-antitoxin system VapC family toxin [Bacteroidales bacterium]|jgi:predicted nucleic acid-binding protein|nr:type II toxin-antitoxin system VapC family toxin [Bacteroidales bacterium]